MIIKFTAKADLDYEYHLKSGNKKSIRKIKELLTAINIDPHSGMGQPEPLKHRLSGPCQGELTENIGRCMN